MLILVCTIAKLAVVALVGKLLRFRVESVATLILALVNCYCQAAIETQDVQY